MDKINCKFWLFLFLLLTFIFILQQLRAENRQLLSQIELGKYQGKEKVKPGRSDSMGGRDLRAYNPKQGFQDNFNSHKTENFSTNYEDNVGGVVHTLDSEFVHGSKYSRGSNFLSKAPRDYYSGRFN